MYTICSTGESVLDLVQNGLINSFLSVNDWTKLHQTNRAAGPVLTTIKEIMKNPTELCIYFQTLVESHGLSDAEQGRIEDCKSMIADNPNLQFLNAARQKGVISRNQIEALCRSAVVKMRPGVPQKDNKFHFDQDQLYSAIAGEYLFHKLELIPILVHCTEKQHIYFPVSAYPLGLFSLNQEVETTDPSTEQKRLVFNQVGDIEYTSQPSDDITFLYKDADEAEIKALTTQTVYVCCKYKNRMYPLTEFTGGCVAGIIKTKRTVFESDGEREVEDCDTFFTRIFNTDRDSLQKLLKTPGVKFHYIGVRDAQLIFSTHPGLLAAFDDATKPYTFLSKHSELRSWYAQTLNNHELEDAELISKLTTDKTPVRIIVKLCSIINSPCYAEFSTLGEFNSQVLHWYRDHEADIMPKLLVL